MDVLPVVSIVCSVRSRKRSSPEVYLPTIVEKPERHDGPVSLADPQSSCHSTIQPYSQSPITRRAEFAAFQIQSQQHTPTATESATAHELHNIEDEERNGNEIAEAALGQPRRAGEVPFYTGDGTGPASTLDICSPDQSLPRHFLIPSNNHATQTEDDRIYLQKKGVYTLPKPDTCEGLIRAYFYHVHPIMPVLEMATILKYEQQVQLGDSNVLLLWSVFFVAVNFVPQHLYEQEGYVSRKEMKATMYSRAKCMYDNGGERNKVTLLQASLLLGFWHSEQDDHMQPWYWTGIAINLCQMLGLHRDPDSLRYNSAITDHQRRLWRRLWWTCVFRDRWLGLTLGRPLRINLDDSDLPMPVTADLLGEFDDIPEAGLTSYFPQDFPKLAEYWLILIELSLLLGKVLALKNKPVKARPPIHQIDALEAQIIRCRLPDQDEAGLTPLARFYAHHVHLHYQSLLITLYRPSGREYSEGFVQNQQRAEQRRLQLKVDAAASKTNEILDVLTRESLLEYAGPMTPALLVPAMQTHLFNCKYASPLLKRFSFNKLDMCMGVMEEFQKTYTVASIYRGLFMKALQHIFPTYVAGSTLSHHSLDSAGASFVDSHSDTAIVATTSDAFHQLVNDKTGSIPDFIDALIDQTSIFDFWEIRSET
ncbi:hypothetical protein ETB97_008154 [Aspergillus alliaceus]|uniref:Xylanolytic transcriptional activator regulatory domain-containing protein n=1 Tax=Petromyces alliaceus TaxID=209559 RepID=A0A8H5ZX66_PETAA|nr:hypothetical protein ETB97_008154 [Aspergillus burnettii]